MSDDANVDRQRRQDAAAELRRLGLEVDWRLASLSELDDWVMRASRARELRDKFGVSVDWRLFSVAQIDELQALVEKQHASRALQPKGPPTKTAAATRRDRDDILPPTFLAQKVPRHYGGEDDVLPPTSLSRQNRLDDRPLPLTRAAR